MANANTDRQTVILLAAGVEGGLIFLAWLLGLALDQPPVALFTWNAAGFLGGVAAALPMLAGFFLLIRWPLGPFAKIKQFSYQVLRPMLAPCTVIDLLGISVLAGLGEEMLFRGVLQRSFGQASNPVLAVALAAGLFGMLHAVTLTYAALATLAGVYLGWLCLATDNLLVVAVAHALYDFVALCYLMRGTDAPVPEAPDPEPTEDGPEQGA